MAIIKKAKNNVLGKTWEMGISCLVQIGAAIIEQCGGFSKTLK